MIGSDVILQQVSKWFGEAQVLKDVAIHIRKGEFFSLLGPSGCGKTTLLRIIAGFEEPTHGSVLIDGTDVSPFPPNKRRVNTIFQNYALFSHLTVFENVAFPLRIKKQGKREIQEKVEELLDLTQMRGHEKKKPGQLSGGQKQRVAIARALANEPSVLLLDEPLSALDAKLRQHMLIELDALHDKVGITFIYVTHDQQEALSVSDRIAVLNEGRVCQVGTPFEIYESPADLFTATFIGETNMFSGIVTDVRGDLVTVDIKNLGTLLVTMELSDLEGKRKIQKNTHVTATIRPEKINITRHVPDALPPDTNLFPCRVEEVIYNGFQSKFFVQVENHFLLKAFKQHLNYNVMGSDIRWNDPAYIFWNADDGYIVEVNS